MTVGPEEGSFCRHLARGHFPETNCFLVLPPKAARPNNQSIPENVWFLALQKITWPKIHFGILFKQLGWGPGSLGVLGPWVCRSIGGPGSPCVMGPQRSLISYVCEIGPEIVDCGGVNGPLQTRSQSKKVGGFANHLFR